MNRKSLFIVFLVVAVGFACGRFMALMLGSVVLQANLIPRKPSAAAAIFWQAPAPSVLATTGPILSRYLFLAEPNFGRFSNNRLSFSEAMGISRLAGRTLYIPPFKACNDEGPASLWNLTQMSDVLGSPVVEDRLSNSQLASLCGASERIYVWTDGFTKVVVPGTPEGQHETSWRGLIWPVSESRNLPLEFFPKNNASAFILDNKGDLAYVEPYRTYFTERHTTREMKGYLTDDWLAHLIAALPHKCVVIHALYMQVNWASMPGMLPLVAKSFVPSSSILSAVSAWFARERVAPDTAVAVHIRLGDMVDGHKFGMAHMCTRDAGFVIDEIKAMQARFVGAAQRPLLIASDDFGAVCAQTVMSAFPDHRRVESGGKLSGCSESAFTHEVLGRSVGFVGNSLSTFSIIAQWIRITRGIAQPLSQTYPEGANPLPMTSFWDK